MTGSDTPNAGLTSKDFADFADFADKRTIVEGEAEKTEKSKRARILQLIGTAEEHLQASNSIIQNANTVADTFKVTKQVVNALLAPAKDLVDLLGALSDIHPAIGVIATVFKAIVKLEMDRQENDKQIAVLYDAMANMLIVLAYLDDVFRRQDGLQNLLNKKLKEIVDLIKEFGNFCDLYYKHRSFVRFLRSAKYKELLAGFAESFANMKRELEGLVSQRTALTVHKTSDTVTEVAASVSQLVAFMEIHSNKEREAEALVAAKGGVEADESLLAEVAKKLGDQIQINSTVQFTLRQDLAQQLKDNHMFFDIKMKSVQDHLTEKINRSTTTILLKMDEGPHELIHDPEIKQVWKDMKWRNTVKCRHFVSAVQHHFEQKFIKYAREHDGLPHQDLWTLDYLSRVIYYPAIGDAIDEDSSGYVSLHELNHFFQSRPQGWSVPQWLAYWAAGWYADNLRYRDKIMSRLQFLQTIIDQMHPENKDTLQGFLEAIHERIIRIVESLYDDLLDYFEDDLAESTEMRSLRDKFTELATREVEEQLVKSKYELDDKRMLMIAIGNPRLESRLFCMMHRLLKRHHKVFDLGKDKPLQGDVTIAMVNSWNVIFDAFEKRMRALSESWRQQRMDIDLQAQWYANGLFEDWYKYSLQQPEVPDVYDEEWMDDDYDTETQEDEDELVEYATRPPTALDDVQGETLPETGYPNEDDGAEPENEEDLEERHTPEEATDSTQFSRGAYPDTGIGHNELPVPGIPALEARMSRLEEKVDDMRHLMSEILKQLKGT